VLSAAALAPIGTPRVESNSAEIPPWAAKELLVWLKVTVSASS
jgi:hypothetical protein